MKKVTNFLIGMLFFLLLLQSCNKREDISILTNEPSNERLSVSHEDKLVDESITGDYEIRAGIIHFKNLDTYIKSMKNSEKFLTTFKEKNPTFISFKKIAVDALKRAESAPSSNEMKKIVNQNSYYDI